MTSLHRTNMAAKHGAHRITLYAAWSSTFEVLRLRCLLHKWAKQQNYHANFLGEHNNPCYDEIRCTLVPVFANVKWRELSLPKRGLTILMKILLMFIYNGKSVSMLFNIAKAVILNLLLPAKNTKRIEDKFWKKVGYVRLPPSKLQLDASSRRRVKFYY